MQYTNSQILSAVLNRFLQPVIKQMAGAKINSMSFVQAINNKLRATGFVGANYSIVTEVMPFIEPVTGALTIPMLNQYISQLPDESIPAVAHGIVDKAITDGTLSLLDGNVEMELEDLKELKHLLNLNLPTQEVCEYKVIENEEVD